MYEFDNRIRWNKIFTTLVHELDSDFIGLYVI